MGSLIGAIAGGITGVPVIAYVASAAGGAIGGHFAAPADRKERGAVGGGVGAVILGPIGAALGGYIGGQKPDRRGNPRRRTAKAKVGERVQLNIPGYPGDGRTGVVRDYVTVKGRRGAHVQLDRAYNGKRYALVAASDIEPIRGRQSNRELHRSLSR